MTTYRTLAKTPDATALKIGPGQTCGYQRLTSGKLVVWFDDTTSEHVLLGPFVLPPDFVGTTVKCKIIFCPKSTVSGKTASWNVYCQAITPGDPINLNTYVTFAAANNATAAIPTTAYYEAEAMITLANLQSAAAGDAFVLKIERNASADSSGDLGILAVDVWEEA